MLRALVQRSVRSAAVAVARNTPAVAAHKPAIICTTPMTLNKLLLEQIDPKKLTLDSDFFEDLGLDSLDFVEVIMAIEDEFHFEIPDGDSDNMRTPRDIYQYICDRKDIYE
ncbi:unnamed protein product [Gongylonema pulchrum]|uniref:Acyl carrier protein n=1 Tax=Gongylonema pulchrum TaxID=637853 RepID=A0A183CVY2_9BILA|nr:unnamed protein product [Gongylonema pulchrum]